MLRLTQDAAGRIRLVHALGTGKVDQVQLAPTNRVTATFPALHKYGEHTM